MIMSSLSACAAMYASAAACRSAMLWVLWALAVRPERAAQQPTAATVARRVTLNTDRRCIRGPGRGTVCAHPKLIQLSDITGACTVVNDGLGCRPTMWDDIPFQWDGRATVRSRPCVRDRAFAIVHSRSRRRHGINVRERTPATG